MKTAEQIVAAIENRIESLQNEAAGFDVSSPGQDQCLTAKWELESLMDWILDPKQSSTVTADE